MEIRLLFCSISGGEEFKNGKPHPEVFTKTLSKQRVENHDCVVIEDSISGVQSALNANISVIGINTTHSVEELLAEGCQFVIQNYRSNKLNSLFP